MRLPLVLLSALAPHLFASDWPQWRGPLRNGVAPSSPPLLEAIPASGLRELWRSEPIPSNEEGGLATPIVAGGRVFIATVWHRQIPTKTRQFDEKALLQLGFQDTTGLSAELIKKIEDTRASLPPQLRGGKLDEFTRKFADENFDSKQKQLYTAWLSKRFQKGGLAIPLTVFDGLQKQKDTVFSNEDEFKRWVSEQGWADWINEQIFAAVSPTKTAADDVILALDLATGKTIWKTSRPGSVVGFDGSSTPVVEENRIYALGSRRVWCLNAQDGSVVWETSLENERRGLGSSPLLHEGRLFVNAGKLTAFDSATGRILWTQDKAGGLHASPSACRVDDRSLILINGKNLSAVDPGTGAILWAVPAGGDSTPAVEGDLVVSQSFKAELGLVAYRISGGKAEKSWNFPYHSDVLRTQSSPIIYQGRVFLVDDNQSYCLDAATGEKIWSNPTQSTISSPVLADGKLILLSNNGNTVLMLDANASEYRELGRATVRSIWVPSPCLAHGKLILRMKDCVKAWDLAQ